VRGCARKKRTISAGCVRALRVGVGASGVATSPGVPRTVYGPALGDNSVAAGPDHCTRARPATGLNDPNYERLPRRRAGMTWRWYSGPAASRSRRRAAARTPHWAATIPLGAVSAADTDGDPHDVVGTGLGTALSSFAFFASGAAVPVLPFLLGARKDLGSRHGHRPGGARAYADRRRRGSPVRRAARAAGIAPTCHRNRRCDYHISTRPHLRRNPRLRPTPPIARNPHSVVDPRECTSRVDPIVTAHGRDSWL
jgi:hypothetical protein